MDWEGGRIKSLNQVLFFAAADVYVSECVCLGFARPAVLYALLLIFVCFAQVVKHDWGPNRLRGLAFATSLMKNPISKVDDAGWLSRRQLDRHEQHSNYFRSQFQRDLITTL